MDVIKLVLDEEAVKDLPLEFIQGLPAITNDIIMMSIREYLADPNADKDVRAKITASYAEQLGIEDFLNSEETQSSVLNIRDLDYANINPLICSDPKDTIKQLKSWEADIEAILSNPYAVPYKGPVSGNTVKEYKERLMAYVAETGGTPAIKRFLKNFSTYAYLFKDKPSAKPRGTVVKKVVRSNIKYENMLRGIRYLINKLENKVAPATWRYL